MSHRINAILADDIWELLQAVRKGERSPGITRLPPGSSIRTAMPMLIDPKGPIPGTTVFALNQSVRRYRCPKLGA